jgi:hypothetical protein
MENRERKERPFMKKYLSLLLAILMMAATTTQALAEINPGSVLNNFRVQNLDESEPADVAAIYVDANGAQAKRRPETGFFQIDPGASIPFTADESGLPSGFNGSAIVSSNKEVAAFSLMLWQGGQSPDGKTASAYEAFRQGSTKIFFPALYARPDKQETSLTIQSAESNSSATVSITINLYTRSGQLDRTITDNIPKGASKTYNLTASVVANCNNNNDTGNTLRCTEPDGWIGSATVESQNPLAGVAVIQYPLYSASYSAMTTGGTSAYVTQVTRRKLNGQENNPFIEYSGVIVQNLATDGPAEVNVKWTDRDTGAVLYEFPASIPANSSKGFNTNFDADTPPQHLAPLRAALGANRNAGAVIESTNGKQIAAVVILIWTGDNPAIQNASDTYTSQSSGYSKLFLPGVYRRISGNNWLQYSGVIVQNVGGSACNNFDVNWYAEDGSTLLTFKDSLTPGQSHGYNTRFGAGGSNVPAGKNVADLGDNYRGSVVVDAPGCQLIGSHTTNWPVWTDNTINLAFGK